MAESVVSSVGQTIGKLLIDEAKFLWGVEGKVEDLQRELRLIRCLLSDADARREHNRAVGECVAQLRDIAYDAEDVIERYILRVAPKKVRNVIKAYVCFVAKCTCFQVHVVGTEIEGLKSSISNLRMRMQDLGLQPVNEGNRERARALMQRPTTYAHFEEDIVGRQDSIKVLVEEMLKDGKHHRVISICGMGGVGKTTLAKKVLARDEVKNNFDGFAWASISQDCRVNDILVGILVKLDPDRRENVKEMRDDELFETLYNIQQKKRCIVVLDDIWTKQAWDGLRAAFPVEKTRSKLLITTRNREVAEHIDPHGFLLELQCLSPEESWELLSKRVFPETNAVELSSVGPGVGQGIAAGEAVKGITTQSKTERQQIPVIDVTMKSLGDELLKKCGGLPLAVNLLGGLLAVNEWATVHKKINLHFSGQSDVSKVLALSYDDLPWHLKPCFLYLGSFPEDAEIPATKVLHMWIAEGFVSLTAYDKEREVTVEDVAEQYLMELVNRGMVQGRSNFSRKIKSCRLHDLMRDLCVLKAGEERFLSILNIQQDHETEECSPSMGIESESTCKTRRLSLNMRGSAEINMTARAEQIGRTMLHLRTLMFFYPGQYLQSKLDQFQPIFTNCKFLRVLKLEKLIMSGNLPESIGDLVHLRFLSLAGSELEGLPQSMGNLVCMEFLDLHVRRRICDPTTGRFLDVTVPNVLWKMRRLRHLRLPYHFVVGEPKKLRLDTLKNLQMLRNFSTENCDVNDIGKLINLQKLTVRRCDELEIIPQLAKFTLKHLQSSSFIFRYDSFTEGELSKMSSYHQACKLRIGGKIEKLPEHKNLPQQLRKLVLIESQLEEDPMPILEKLQHLVVLMLCYDAFVGKEMVCSAGGFPQLKHLLLFGLFNLEEWRVAEGAMPLLSRLGIDQCPKLKEWRVAEGVSTYHSYFDDLDEYQKISD